MATITQTGLSHETSSSSITLQASTFLANGHPILTQVPPNITTTPADNVNAASCFVGFDTDQPSHRHVAPIGRLSGIRFMSIFRFKMWWSTHWDGTTGSDIENETQIMMLQNSDHVDRPYVLLLPLIEGPFRSSLQPGHNDYVDICLESGSTRVNGSTFRSCLYMHAGHDPFDLMKEAMKMIRGHLGTFKLLEEKTPPRIVDKFGWCTWDAFYLTVDPQGVREGVRGLVDGGCPPGFVIIDDGWQSFCHDRDDVVGDSGSLNCAMPGDQMLYRLTSFEENSKFKEYCSGKRPSERGLGALVRDLKEEFGRLEDVYVWHAFCGYWGGLRPNVPGLPEAQVVGAKLTEGEEKMMRDLAVDRILEVGVGLVSPEDAHKLYDGLHSHLQSVGIDGVKIDVTQILGMVSEDYGGRVELSKAYYKGLTDSVKKHFNGNGVISSMQQCNDFLFLGTQTISLGRVGDDFWCIDPAGDPNGTYWLQGCHMVHCAYNSLWMGNFIHPDWDMFQSDHPCAEFHAASRAISGGPVYVSDSVGRHNFKLLNKLVLPDGTILRCEHYALPTRDCLFQDPLHDAKTMLKIWNLNKYTGVLGVFNCQGGGWCRVSRRNKSVSECSKRVSCFASPEDVEWSKGMSPICVTEEDVFAVYMVKEQNLRLLKWSESVEISLDPFDYELLTVSPVTVLPKRSIHFAPIGLVNMLNLGGAIQSMEFEKQGNDEVRIGVRGHGEMRVFASEKPVSCKVDGVAVEFGYEDQMARLHVPWTDSSRSCEVEYLF
ncbi:hypothetical protein K1719_030402 [Acacia pycnantha]|nr:hypothetical protein K1719_030402 [Acacia pycnantha]